VCPSPAGFFSCRVLLLRFPKKCPTGGHSEEEEVEKRKKEERKKQKKQKKTEPRLIPVREMRTKSRVKVRRPAKEGS